MLRNIVTVPLTFCAYTTAASVARSGYSNHGLNNN